MSYNFGDVDIDTIEFPARMFVDYIRVYQRSDEINVGCDPGMFVSFPSLMHYVLTINHSFS